MKDNRGKQRKVSPSFVTKVDGEQGIVEHTVAVMGNVDLGGDRIHNGAFTKTISERAGKIRVLDSHNSDSVLDVLGKPLALWEVGRDELPADVRARFPDATGALMARTQFLMDTPEGKGAFTRIRDGALGEYSIGYDAVKADYTDEMIGEKSQSIRNLKEIKLWEYSPVPFGMNSATSTLSAKEASSEASCKIKPQIFDEFMDHIETYVRESGQETGSVSGPMVLADVSMLREEVAPLVEAMWKKRDGPLENLDDPPRFVGAEDEPKTAPEIKAGRVFSARNATRIRGHIDGIQQALSDLDDMLSAAMPSIDESETDEQEKIAPAPDEQAAVAHTDEAEPPDQALTSDKLLAEIENALATIQRELSEDERESQRMA